MTRFARMVLRLLPRGWPVRGCSVFGGKLSAGPTDHEREPSGGAESGVNRGLKT
jgi:hypothetical protein